MFSYLLVVAKQPNRKKICTLTMFLLCHTGRMRMREEDDDAALTAFELFNDPVSVKRRR